MVPGALSNLLFFFNETVRHNALQQISNCTVVIDHCSTLPKASGAKKRVVIKKMKEVLYIRYTQ